MKKTLEEQVKKINLNPNSKIFDEIESEWSSISLSIDNLKKIDTTNVEPMVRVDNSPIDFLREDIPKNNLSKSDFLKNASSHKDGLIIISKVIKND